MSINPKWIEKIISGEKTIEVRKTAPKPPFKGYIYCTSVKNMLWQEYVEIHRKIGGAIDGWNSKVVAEFACDKVDTIVFNGSGYEVKDEDMGYTNTIANQSGLYYTDLRDYLGDKQGYALHISDLKIYDEPKELGEFSVFCKDYRNCENIFCDKDTCREGFISITRPPRNYMRVVEITSNHLKETMKHKFEWD